MKAPIEIHFDTTMGLRDAIAYEFYMDNIKDIIQGSGDSGENISEAILKLATSSYLIADLFLSAKEQAIPKKNESSEQES